MFKISLTGDLGSGKSTVCGLIEKQIEVERVSVGKIMRDRAKTLGMTLAEFSAYMETHPEEDNKLDQALAEYEKRDGNYIFDSRLAWHFVPSAFSFYLSVSLDESAKRIYNANRDDESFSSVEETKAKIVERRLSEQKRYQAFYGLDLLDMSNYDAVISTDGKTPEQVVEEIFKIYRERR